MEKATLSIFKHFKIPLMPIYFSVAVRITCTPDVFLLYMEQGPAPARRCGLPTPRSRGNARNYPPQSFRTKTITCSFTSGVESNIPFRLFVWTHNVTHVNLQNDSIRAEPIRKDLTWLWTCVWACTDTAAEIMRFRSSLVLFYANLSQVLT